MSASPTTVPTPAPTPSGAGAPGSATLARVVLAVAGLVAAAVGAGLALAPAAVHAASGGEGALDVVARSDQRGAGVLLAVVGVLLLGAGARGHRVDAALAVGAVAYVAYAAGRVLGRVMDGHPGSGVLVAGVVELAVALVCAAVLRQRRRRGSDG